MVFIFKSISEKIRAKIVSDMFSLSQSGAIEPKLLFDTMKFMKDEKAYLPWSVFLMRVNYYIDMLESSKAFGKFQIYLRDIVEPYYIYIGWVDKQPADDWLDRLIKENYTLFL